MSHQTKVASAFNTLRIENLLFAVPTNTHTEKVRSFGLDHNLIARRKSFKSINLISDPRSSIEKDLQKNNEFAKTDSTNMLAIERKKRRKSFFENVCGSKSSKGDDKSPKLKSLAKEDKILEKEITLTKTNIAMSKQIAKIAMLSAYAEGVYGSTSTIESTDNSLDQILRQNSKLEQLGFSNLNIKKNALCRNPEIKCEFVPLREHCEFEDALAQAADTNQKRFPNYYGNEQFKLVDDLLECDSECVDLDEETLREAFSMGKY